MKKISTFIIAAFLFAIPTLKAQVNKQDSLALVDLYNSTGGKKWYGARNWLTKAPVSTWYGIGVDANNRVDSINLFGVIYIATGSIPNSIGNLIYLTYLNLGGNSLSGAIPASLGNLTNLAYLNLVDDNLTGNIPASLGNLTKLTHLDLKGNTLTDTIPASLGNLTKLTFLNFAVCQLSGSIPTSFGNLIKLQTLYLDLNQLSDSIPTSLGNLTNLTDLEIDNNQLSGSIPSSFGNLTDLKYLILSQNQLTGSIPSSLGNLTNLNDLELWSNNLTGNIPASFGNFEKINQLLLYDNQLSGAIPPSLGNLTTLTDLRLYNNQLTDTIPSSLANIPNLHYLYLDSNKLSGTIPAAFSNLSQVYELYLNSNQLTGSVPSFLGNLPHLNYLYLDNNQFSGAVPSTLGSQAALINLSIGNNQFTFNGIEHLASTNIGVIYWAPQAIVPLTFKSSDTTFSVSVGGTPANDIYKWYNSGNIVATKTSDSTFRPTSNGLYYMAAINIKVVNLTLYSDSININYPANPQDSLALVALYNSTGGANWVNHTNWLTTAPVNTWYGVTLYNWRVTGISLDSNNLKGILPSSLKNLPYLSVLNLSNNQLTFAGMEGIVDLVPDNANGTSFYAPQATVPLQQNGDTLSVSVGGTPSNNTFKWYRNDTLVATLKSDSTYAFTNNGKYYVVATNAIATELALYSDTITISGLPIKDITLKLKETNGQVLLQWQTIGEVNTASFTIQRSTDGSSFTDLATKEAVGSGNNGYSFSPPAPLKGVTYYRIKVVDKDGSFSYSNVASVQFTVNGNQLTVYPNPAKESVTIKGNHIASLQVIDNMGRVVKTISLHDATNPTMQVSNLTKGVYHLRIQTTDGIVNAVSFVKE